jgi:hypothetical protein
VSFTSKIVDNINKIYSQKSLNFLTLMSFGFTLLAMGFAIGQNTTPFQLNLVVDLYILGAFVFFGIAFIGYYYKPKLNDEWKDMCRKISDKLQQRKPLSNINDLKTIKFDRNIEYLKRIYYIGYFSEPNPDDIDLKGCRNEYCHEDSYQIYKKCKSTYRFVTGYSYYNGRWERHSWVIENTGKIIEATEIKREAYYGCILLPDETDRLCEKIKDCELNWPGPEVQPLQ